MKQNYEQYKNKCIGMYIGSKNKTRENADPQSNITGKSSAEVTLQETIHLSSIRMILRQKNKSK